MECQKVYETVSDNQNNQEWIKCYRHKSDISMSKMSICLKRIFSIGEKCSDRFNHKGDTWSKEIMHSSELYKHPYENEIQDEHNSTNHNIAYKLYETFVLLWEMEEKLRHLQIYAHNLAYKFRHVNIYFEKSILESFLRYFSYSEWA